MPGPVSDSYDPEFGTNANAQDVTEALQAVVKRLDGVLGPQLHNIVEVAQRRQGKREPHQFSERELRLIRFSINRALESI